MATISELFKKYVAPVPAQPAITPKIATGATTGATVGTVKPTTTSAIAGANMGFDMSNYKADTSEAGVPQSFFPKPIDVNLAKSMNSTMKTATGAGVQAGTQAQPQNALQYNPQNTAGLNVIQQAQSQAQPQPTQYPMYYGGQQTQGEVRVPQTIASETLSQPSTFQAAPSGQQDSSDQLLAMLGPSMQQSQQTTTQAEALANQMTASGMSQLQDQQSKLRQEISSLAGDMSQAGRKAELEQQYGLNEQLTQLSELNKQIAAKYAQYNQAITENQGRATLTSNIAGREGQLKRQMASEIGGLTAMAEAMQGNIDMARNIIKETVALEYEDKQNQLNTLLQQLEWNKEDMTKEEQKEAAKMEAQAKAEQAQLEIAQSNREQVMEIAMMAAKNGAGMDQLYQIMSADSPENALLYSGGYLSSAEATALTGATVPMTADERSRASNMISKIDQIMFSENLNDVLGPIQSRLPSLREGSAELEAYIENLKNNLTLDNLSFLKGTMSDKDIDFITSASTALNIKMSPEAFKAELQNIRQTLSAGLSGANVPTGYENSKNDVLSVEQIVSGMNETGQNIFMSAIKDGVPYSYLNRNMNSIIQMTKDYPDMTEQDLYETIVGGWQSKLGFSQVGGDTKQASIASGIRSFIPQGTKYTRPEDGECGYWSRKIVDYPSGTGDTLASKTAFVKKNGYYKNEYLKIGPKVGDVIFTSDSPTYGHVAVVNAVNPDGTVTLSESNYKGHYLVSHDRKIALNDPRIVGAVRGKLKTNISNIA